MQSKITDHTFYATPIEALDALRCATLGWSGGAEIYALLGSAFFAHGTTWQQRALSSVETLAMAGCVCFASGLLFRLTAQSANGQQEPLTRTLPVHLFLWSLGATALLFLLSRYLEVYYVPTLWKNQPY